MSILDSRPDPDDQVARRRELVELVQEVAPVVRPAAERIADAVLAREDRLRALIPAVYWQDDEMPEGAAYDGDWPTEIDEPTVNGNRRPYVVITPALYDALVQAARSTP